MQKQVFFKRLHAFLGRGLTITYITTESCCWEEHTKTPQSALSSLYFFHWIMTGWWDSAYSSTEKTQPFQEKLFDKQKKVGVQSVGPAQMGGYAEKRRMIKYEWEWAVLTCKLRASVCHRYWADGKEVIPAAHSSANKAHRPCPCNWSSNGSGWWGMVLEERGQVQARTSNGPAWRLSRNVLSTDTSRWSRWKVTLIHLHRLPAIWDVLCSISSGPQGVDSKQKTMSYDFVTEANTADLLPGSIAWTVRNNRFI